MIVRSKSAALHELLSLLGRNLRVSVSNIWIPTSPRPPGAVAVVFLIVVIVLAVVFIQTLSKFDMLPSGSRSSGHSSRLEHPAQTCGRKEL